MWLWCLFTEILYTVYFNYLTINFKFLSNWDFIIYSNLEKYKFMNYKAVSRKSIKF
jgi:hypothetical protein